MSDIKWEYCVLEWFRFNVEPAAAKSPNGETSEAKEQTIAIFGVRYAGSQGNSVSRVLHKLTTANVKEKSKEVSLVKIMGLLGGGGWELVSMNQEPDRMEMCTITSAYFKRPVVEGRSVEEPNIELNDA